MSRFRALAVLLTVLWVLEIVNFLTGHRLNGLGLLPRHASGIPGIALAPLLHANLAHLVSNTGGLAGLGALVSARGERHFVISSLAIVLLGNTMVWLLGRPAIHVGASGLVFGLFGVLVARAWHERTLVSVGAGALALAFYGSLLWGLSPFDARLSWESHAAGLVAGVIVGSWRMDRPNRA